jgi:cysteinyl-tRNA synthetase
MVIPVPKLSATAWGFMGCALALLLVIGWALRLDGLRASYKAQRDTATTKLETTASSVDRLTAELKRVRDEQQALAVSDAQRKQASRETLAVIEAASKLRRASIESLNNSAKKVRKDDDCAISDAVREVWK